VPIELNAEARALAVSVIVPATDRPTTLPRCRAAILAAADPPDEVLVIEDLPPTGPGAARNAGAARARGSILVFVDSDVVVSPDAFTRIRMAFAADPELTAVFGCYDDSPSPHGVVSTFRNLLHHHMHVRSSGLASTFWAGLGAIRADDFFAVGGFDERRFRSPSVEDIDLGLRLHETGRRVTLDPNIRGQHLKRWSLWDMVVTDMVLRGVPWTVLLLEHGPGAARLNASRRHRLSAALCAVAVAALAARRPRLALLPASGFLRINMSFYGLLMRRAGPRAALAGIGLHILHNLTALAAAPVGVVAFVTGRSRPSALAAGRPVPRPDRHARRSERFRRAADANEPVVAGRDNGSSVPHSNVAR
jgi:hypothetical protein